MITKRHRSYSNIRPYFFYISGYQWIIPFYPDLLSLIGAAFGSFQIEIITKKYPTKDRCRARRRFAKQVPIENVRKTADWSTLGKDKPVYSIVQWK